MIALAQMQQIEMISGRMMAYQAIDAVVKLTLLKNAEAMRVPPRVAELYLLMEEEFEKDMQECIAWKNSKIQKQAENN